MSTPTKRLKRAESLNKLEVAKVAAEPNPLPEWVTETPEEMYYDLNMGCEYDGSLQLIDITREEFIALKQRLAELRGYKVPTEGSVQAA